MPEYEKKILQALKSCLIQNYLGFQCFEGFPGHSLEGKEQDICSLSLCERSVTLNEFPWSWEIILYLGIWLKPLR